ncbi:MAG: phage major capsid protein [Firmicutes bacterium]|nr:phage major capsid protein [Bacillota bacterium]
MITLQSAENAMRTLYLDAIAKELNIGTNPLLTKIEQTSSDVWGKEIRKAVSCGGKYVQFVSTLKNLYCQIEFSDKTIRAFGVGPGVDLANAEIREPLDAARFNLSRMLYSNGSGCLGNIGAKANGAYPVTQPQRLIEGSLVDVYDGSQNTHQRLRIAHINRDKSTIKFEEDPITAIGENCVLYVSRSKDKELTGIAALFDTAKPIYGLERGPHSFLTPYIKQVNGKWNDGAVEQAIEATGNAVDFIACSANVKYAYQEQMALQKRSIDVMELEGGFKTLSFSGIPLVYDRFVESGSMYLLNTKAFKLHRLCDWRYLEDENGRILRPVSGKAAYTATLVKYCDLVCDRPDTQAKLTGILR